MQSFYARSHIVITHNTKNMKKEAQPFKYIHAVDPE